jgi:hypothetical protein
VTSLAPKSSQDTIDDLQILAFFHYAIAAMIAMLALIPATYYAIGVVLTDPSEGAPVAGLSLAFPFGLSLGLLLAGFALAALVGWGGRCMQQRTAYRTCVASAVGACLFLPLGTLLGIVSLATLTRADVKRIFADAKKPVPARSRN